MPIDQALAPYTVAGCRAVTGLVPRALFMEVTLIYFGNIYFYGDISICILADLYS